MCTGRIDLTFVLRAFSNGVDGVIIAGCHLNECHYLTDGNYHALNMVQLCKKLLEHVGVNPERLRTEWLSAGEGIRFAEVMNDFGKKITGLGPLGQGEGIDPTELMARVAELVKLGSYIKTEKREKLGLHPRNVEEYAKLYTSDEIDALLRDVVSYYIDPDKCKACMICYRKCPVEAIAGGRNRIHVIDQEKCIRCGTCLEVCPARFAAVTKISGGAVPPAIPEEARSLAIDGEQR